MASEMGLSKSKLKAQAKEADDQQAGDRKPTNDVTRIIYVGDDTGLLKHLSMSLAYEDVIISMPIQRKKWPKRK